MSEEKIAPLNTIDAITKQKGDEKKQNKERQKGRENIIDSKDSGACNLYTLLVRVVHPAGQTVWQLLGKLL